VKRFLCEILDSSTRILARVPAVETAMTLSRLT
jgi:hypothetical protein